MHPGTYDNAVGWPGNDSQPGLNAGGNGEGCTPVSGRFTITEATYNPFDELQTFAVNFDMHCDGSRLA